MKKVSQKISKKQAHKETEIEMLARLISVGFEKNDKQFEKIDERFKKIDERFGKIDERFNKIDERFDLVDSQLFSINHELKDHSVRLDRIERKQMGVLTNLDETVQRSEFNSLVRRIDSLEKKIVKK